MTSATEFQTKVTKAATNMDRFDGIVNGGPTTTVATDSGTVPSLAKVIADTGYTGSAVTDAQAARDAAAGFTASAAGSASVAAASAATATAAATASCYLATWAGGASAATIQSAIQSAINSAAGTPVLIAKSGTTNTGITVPDNTTIIIPEGVTITEASGQTQPLFVNAGCAGTTTNTGIRIDVRGKIVGNNVSKAVTGRTGVIGTIAMIGVSNGYVRVNAADTCQRVVQWGNGTDFEVSVGKNTSGLPISIFGPASNFVARVQDQAASQPGVVLSAVNASAYSPTVGDITDFIIDGVYVSSTTGSHVRLIAGTVGTRGDINDGLIRNLTGTAGGAAAVDIPSTLTGGGDVGTGLIDRVRIEGIACAAINSNNLLHINQTVGDMSASILISPVTTSLTPCLVDTSGAVTGRLSVSVVGTYTGAVSGSIIFTKGPIAEVELTGRVGYGSAAADNAAVLIQGTSTASVNTIIFNEFSQSMGGGLVYKQSGSAAVAPEIYLSNVTLADAKRAFFIIGAGASIRSANTSYTGLTVNFVRADTAAVTAREINTTVTYSGGTESALIGGGTFTRILPASAPVSSTGETVVVNTGTAVTEIQTALDAANAAGGGVVRIYQPGTLLINDTLTIGDNTTLDLGPATEIKKATGVTGNPTMIRNKTLPSVSSYAITNSNIRIRGGIWNPNYAGGVTSASNNGGTGLGSIPAGCTGNMLFFGVRGLTIEDVTVRSGAGAMFQIVGDHTKIRNIRVPDGEEYKFDFVHINGPSRFVDIDNIRAWSHDDLVAINAWDWVRSGPTVGDITDVNISRIALLAPEVNTNTQGAIRLLSGSRTVGGITSVGNIARVVIDTVEGMCSAGNGVIGTDPTADPNNPGGSSPNVPTGGTIRDIMVRNLSRVRLFNSTPCIRIAQTCKNWSVDGLTLHDSNLGSGVVVSSTGTIDRLTLSNYVGDAAAGIEGYVNCSGTIGRLTLNNCAWTGKNSGGATSGSGANGFIYISGSGAWINEIVLNGHKQTYGECLLYSENTALGSTCKITLDGCRIDNVKHVLWPRLGTFKVQASATDFVNIPNDIARFDGAAASVTFEMAESGCSMSGAGTPYSNVSSAASIRHDGRGFTVATSVITAPVNGDIVRTSTGLSLYKSGAWAAL